MASRPIGFDRPLLRRVAAPIAAFLATSAVGIAGFVLLADVGVVDAAFWLLDPTSIELHYQSGDHGGETVVKAFSLVVFSALIVVGVWIGETALSAAFGGQMRVHLKRVQVTRMIDDLSDHVIICGYGIFGRTIAARLRENGRSVVAIERDETEFERIDADDVLAINADAREEATLREAGIERASTVVAAIDDSNANIQIAMTASGVAPQVRTVVRVGDEQHSSLARRAGADEVIVPEIVSGEQVSEHL